MYLFLFYVIDQKLNLKYLPPSDTSIKIIKDNMILMKLFCMYHRYLGQKTLRKQGLAIII